VGLDRGDARHDEVRELLAAYALGAVDVVEAGAIEAHLTACAPCRGEVRAYEAVAGTATGGVDRVWRRISATLAGRREDLDVFLAGVLDSGGVGGEGGGDRAPVRVLIVADSDAARILLAHKLGDDDRFAIVAEAATPAEVLGAGVASLPDLVLVKLRSTDRVWLDALGELASWSPRTRLIAVSGIHAEHLADVVLTPSVVRDLAAGRPPSAGVAARSGRGPGLTAAPAHGGTATPEERPGGGGAAAPRSLIHEVMRQMGIPVRTRTAHLS
jgi:CheY-like chemotaxis protein